MGDIKLKQASSGLKFCHWSLLPFSACWALPFDPVAFASNQRVGQGSIRDDMLGKRQGTHGTRKDLCPTLFLPGHYSLCGLGQMCSPPWASRHNSVRWGRSKELPHWVAVRMPMRSYVWSLNTAGAPVFCHTSGWAPGEHNDKQDMQPQPLAPRSSQFSEGAYVCL